MNPQYQEPLEEYTRIIGLAQDHVMPADYQVLRRFLQKIEAYALQGVRGARTRVNARRLVLRGSAYHPGAVQAAHAVDRILENRLVRAGKGDEWDAHLARARKIWGRWPPGTKKPPR
jgi:hypothetical protein